MCPRAVGLDSGRCLRTKLDVRSGQIANRPALMASIQVEDTGLKATLCRYLASFGRIDCVYVLYARRVGVSSCSRMEALAPR